MFIRIWHPCIVSLIVIPCIIAKPFSLNEAIAAEERQKQSLGTNSPPDLPTESQPQRFYLKKSSTLKPLKSRLLKTAENILPRSHKILSPLKHRKSFKIKSSLIPKKIRYPKKALFKRKNKKRHIVDERINRKYVPLLRHLSMLFDNILASDTGDDSDEFKRSKYRAGPEDENDAVCTCTNKSGKKARQPPSSEKTTISATPVVEVTTDAESTQPITTAPTTKTNYSTNGNISSIGQNKELPILLTRNTDGSRGDDIRIGKRSGPTFHSSVEGNIARDHGDSEHNTGIGEDNPSSGGHEENSNSSTRIYEGGDGYRGRLRGDRDEIRRPVYRRRTNEADFYAQTQNPLGDLRGNFNEHKGENNIKIRGDEAEGPKFLPNSIRGNRFESEHNVSSKSEPIQSQESNEESNDSIPDDYPGDQRFTYGNGASTTEVKKTSSKNATVIPINGLDPVIMFQDSPKHKAPFVTIFDGYSVARDKNGANKLAEQSIRLHS